MNNDEDDIETNDVNLEDMNDEEMMAFLDHLETETEKPPEIDDLEEIDEGHYCVQCDTPDLLIEDVSLGIIVCSGCGNVVGDLFDEKPEQRDYGDDSGKNESARCIGVTNHFLPQSSLGTTISGNSRSKIKTLHGWSAMPYRERSLYNVLKKIQAKCRESNILKCIEDDAKILYKNISECKHVRGKNKGKQIIIRGSNRESLIAACVYYACKRKKQTRSPKEIADIFKLEIPEVTRGIKTFLTLLKIRKMEYETGSTLPEEFIPRYGKELHIKSSYIDKAVTIAKNVQLLNLASVHTPQSVATACILLMAQIENLSINKKMIATGSEVTEVTINKAFKKIEPYEKIVINDELTQKLLNKINRDRKDVGIPSQFKNRYSQVIKEEHNVEDEMKFDIDRCNDKIKDFRQHDKQIKQQYQDMINSFNQQLRPDQNQPRLFQESVQYDRRAQL